MTARLLLALPAIALLAACSTGVPGSPDTDNGGGSAGAPAGSDCSIYDGSEVAPFSSSLVVTPPAAGAVWGDGTTLSFEVTPEASDLIPQARFVAIVDGSLIDAASTVLTESAEGSNVWESNLNLFDDDLEGQAAIAELFTVSDQSFDGALNEGDTLVMGRYCVTLKN